MLLSHDAIGISMSRNRKPIIPTGEVIFTPGTPFINGRAPRARSLSAAFLHEGQEHFESKGKAIWQKMFEDYPVEYFWGLITLAKVLKIETGQPGDFDKPRTREEALDRLERTAGPVARQMLEQFLEQVAEVEAKYLEEQSTD
jgi:hypothetical protein